MNSTLLLECLGVQDLTSGATGAIVGIYDFNSGITSGTNNIRYNLLYPTGYHFSGDDFFGPTVPLISVGTVNALNGYFSGKNTYSFGYSISGDFSTFLEVGYSGCQRNLTGVSYILLSTAQNPTGITDKFFLGIDEGHQLYFGTSGYYKTLPYELGETNFIYFSLSNQKYVEFGVYDIPTANFYKESITLNNTQSLINQIYLGGFLNNTDTSYTGYSGQILNALLFDSPLEVLQVSGCSDCILATGKTTGIVPVTTISVPIITGVMISGVMVDVVTGYGKYTGQLTKSDNTTVNVLLLSGITQSQTGENQFVVLTGTTTIQVTGTPTKTFLTDSNKINRIAKFDIELHDTLVSGDIIEIYTYPKVNNNLNRTIKNLQFPNSTNFVQLIGNGLVETRNVDYQVIKNQISGFYEDDVLGYDLFTGSSYVIPFSGLYSGVANLKYVNGNYVISSGQWSSGVGQLYLDLTGDIFSYAIITGISGQWIRSDNYDVFLNGQRLISGYHYLIDTFNTLLLGDLENDKYGVQVDTTRIPTLVINGMFDSTGGLTGVSSYEDSELTLLPRYPILNYYYSELNSTTTRFNNITGFSEQVWINGIRQKENVEYNKVYPCSLSSGFSFLPNVPFKFYDNDTGYFNII